MLWLSSLQDEVGASTCSCPLLLDHFVSKTSRMALEKDLSVDLRLARVSKL